MTRIGLLGSAAGVVALAGIAAACGSSDAGGAPAPGDPGSEIDGSAPGPGTENPDGGPAADAAKPAERDGGTDAGPLGAARLIAGGTYYTCAILGDGAVKCWGEGSPIGALGLEDAVERGSAPGQMGASLPRVNLGTGRTAIAITANLLHTCVILDTHQVKCWGSNHDGELGLGTNQARGSHMGDMGDALPVVNLGPGRTARAIAAGWNHTCAVLDNGEVKCWGNSQYGQLGLGDTTTRGTAPAHMGAGLPAVNLGTGRTAVDIAASDNSTCAVLDDHSVKCWGFVTRLGLGISGNNHRGDQPNEMGDNLPAVQLGTGRTAKQIATNGLMACALLDNDSVKCWGVVYGLYPVRSWGREPGDMGDALPAIPLGTGRTAKALSVVGPHACVIVDDDSLKCWGTNTEGQLGLGNKEARGDEPADMGDALPAIDLGTGAHVRAVGAGGALTCAVLDGGKMKCWGRNAHGELGLGDTNARGDDPNEMGDLLPFVDLGP